MQKLSRTFMALMAVAAMGQPVLGQDHVEDFVAAKMPGYRIARAADYEKMLGAEDRGKALIEADFNGDGKGDYAVLVLSETAREYRVYYLIASAGGLQPQLLLARKWIGATAGAVRTPMFFKPAGQPGISERDYNDLTRIPPARLAKMSPAKIQAERQRKAAHYVAVPAIEVWTGSGLEASAPVGDLNDLAYCSRTWFYQSGTLKAFDACD